MFHINPQKERTKGGKFNKKSTQVLRAVLLSNHFTISFANLLKDFSFYFITTHADA
jgi:hypothetical protein